MPFSNLSRSRTLRRSNSGIDIPLLAVLLCVACQSAPPIYTAQLESRGFLLLAVDGATADQLNALSKHAAQAWDELLRCCYVASGRPRIIVYRSRQLYAAQDPRGLESMARYHPLRRELHLWAPAASAAVLRHELSHALLFAQRPDAPYWFQEGVALWLQEGAVALRPECRLQMHNLHPAILGQLDAARTSRISSWDEFARPEQWSVLAAVRSGFYIKFLWQSRRLGPTFRNFLSSAIELEHHLQLEAADDQRSELERFERWLQSDAARSALPGC